MAQGVAGSDAYLEQWRWVDVQERPEPADALTEALVAEFRSQSGGDSSRPQS